MPPIVDYWCNAFLPDRQALWDASLAQQGVPLKVRRNADDSFAAAAEMVARMDALGIATLVLPTCDLPPHAALTDYEPFATRVEECAALAKEYPGRFKAAWSIDPAAGYEGVERAREILEQPWVIALHVHTHSFDKPFDAPDYYPYYALAAETGVPFVMQAGTSGGLMPSECGKPIAIDRPALYFPQTTFVLSHAGWPWVEEAVAMAIKFPNVVIGTAALPPKRWHAALVDFLRGPGRHKTLFGTSFPTVGHRHALGQLAALELDAETEAAVLGGNARRVFGRLEQEG